MSNTEQNKIIERLEFLSDCVTKGRESIDRNFHMSIPARPLEDADLVLSTAGCMIRDSYAEIAALRDEVEHYRNQLDIACKDTLTPADAKKIKEANAQFASENLELQNEVEWLNKLKDGVLQSFTLEALSYTSSIEIAKSMAQARIEVMLSK